MPPRRYGSARRQLDYLDLLALTITNDERRFGGEAEMEAVYWQHREEILSHGNRRGGHRPEAFWRFEARFRPVPERDPSCYDGLDDGPDEAAAAERMLAADRLVELAKLRWLLEHGLLEEWEREELLAWARRHPMDGSWWQYRAGDLVELLGG